MSQINNRLQDTESPIPELNLATEQSSYSSESTFVLQHIIIQKGAKIYTKRLEANLNTSTTK